MVTLHLDPKLHYGVTLLARKRKQRLSETLRQIIDGALSGKLGDGPEERSAQKAVITVHVEGGMVQDVSGVPAGYELRVEDYDHADETQPTWDAARYCNVTVYGGSA
jgi:hypothetical protein